VGIDWRVTLTHIIKKCAARLWTGDASCGPVGGSCKIMFDYSRNVLCMELYLYVKVIDKVLSVMMMVMMMMMMMIDNQ
jgi:hypothetical protein